MITGGGMLGRSAGSRGRRVAGPFAYLMPEDADLVAQRQHLDVPGPTVPAADEHELGMQGDERVEDRRQQRRLPDRRRGTLADRSVRC